MENLAVKVLYKGKIIIIGKGIRTQQSIVNDHLKKRFNISQEQINLFSLQYEDEAQNLNEAYQKAFQKGKQSVKIRIQLMKPQEKLMQQSKSQSKKDNVTTLPKDNNVEEESIQIQKQQTQSTTKIGQKEEPHVVFEQSKDRRSFQIEKDNGKQEDESKQEDRVIDQKGQTIEQSRKDIVEQKVEEGKYFPLVAQISEQNIHIPNNSELQQAQNTKIEHNDENTKIEHNDENTERKQQIEKEQKLLVSNQDQNFLLLENINLNQGQDQQADKDSQKSSSGLLQGQQQSASENQQECQVQASSQLKLSDKFPVGRITPNQQRSLQIKSIKSEKQSSHIIPNRSYQNQKQNPDYYFKSKIPRQFSILITQMMNNLKIQMQKQFDTKLNQIKTNHTILQLKHSDLQSKYQDLLQKYQSLTFNVSKYMLKDEKQQKNFWKQQKMESKPQLKGYEKIPYFDAQEQEKEESQPQVQIQEIETSTQIQVGQSIRPRFFLVNTGSKEWPKNVVAISQKMQRTKIGSLLPNEEFILQMEDIELKRVGQKISRIYRLGYENKRGELKMFGRRFGINLTGVGKQKIVEKKADQFVDFINKLMLSNGMMVENLQHIIENLRDASINQGNYKEADKQYIMAIMKLM